MIPWEPPALPATVVVAVPEVVTPASDRLRARLRPGLLRLVLPVWEAPNGKAASARVAVGATACAPVALQPGAVVRVGCTTVVRPGSVVVRVVVDGSVVTSWRHSVG